MKITVVTSVLNNERTLHSCMESIVQQTYQDIEHIVIDGGSTDGSLEILGRFRDRIAVLVSEPDDGLYYALNKGLRIAAGDVIGFLHADDVYADREVLASVATSLMESGCDCCYGDLEYVSRADTGRVVRHWRAQPFEEGLFQRGWMPPHPTFFVKRSVYDRCGVFDTGFRISADYELMLRFLERCRISSVYIPRVLLRMRTGGISNRSIRNILVKTREDYRAWEVNGLRRRFYTIPLKNLSKIAQFVRAF